MPRIRSTVSRTNPNTTIETLNSGRIIRVRLHGSVVFSYDQAAGEVTLDTCGWCTPTTIRRMNEALREFVPSVQCCVGLRDFKHAKRMTIKLGVNTTPIATSHN